MSSQSTLYIIIALLILGGGTWFLLQGTEQTNQNDFNDADTNVSEMPEPETNSVDTDNDTIVETVTYNESGFTPETVTITQGETVRFVNETTNPMWVASDEHPTHTNYAGTSLSQHCSNGSENAFDQCEIGETFTFTFNQTGTWEYHNHLLPNDQGSVIVE